MIQFKSDKDIKILREGGHILAAIVEELSKSVAPGVPLFEINDQAERLADFYKAKPSFKGYKSAQGVPYPASVCISVNDEVVHGIGARPLVLKEGDIVSLDMGLIYKGLFTDHAVTVAVGRVPRLTRDLIDTTKQSLLKGIQAIKPDGLVDDISKTVQAYVESKGFSVVRQLVGHGVGYAVHEEPAVPNFVDPKWKTHIKLEPGLVIAIEPMVTAGSWQVNVAKDGWTVKTSDGSLSAHFEHTVAVTQDGYEILTLV
ncbi:MAG: type I methionyl aminopeptidase [Parcubacteria group bacterium]|nr:type I methionyl aminopeptidase [Parcubacteria group bacterium]